MDPAKMTSEERLERIEALLAIAKGDAPTNRLDRIENLLEQTNIALRKSTQILTRLAERHEGLTESVELLLHEGREILRKLGGKGGRG
jgi:hypothetical protein